MLCSKPFGALLLSNYGMFISHSKNLYKIFFIVLYKKVTWLQIAKICWRFFSLLIQNVNMHEIRSSDLLFRFSAVILFLKPFKIKIQSFRTVKIRFKMKTTQEIDMTTALAKSQVVEMLSHSIFFLSFGTFPLHHSLPTKPTVWKIQLIKKLIFYYFFKWNSFLLFIF